MPTLGNATHPVAKFRSNTSVGKVMRAVRDVCGVSIEAIKGRSRASDVIAARFAVIIILRRRLGWSTLQIGAKVRRDHSTVCHILNQVEGRSPMMARCRIAIDIAANAELAIDGYPVVKVGFGMSANDNQPKIDKKNVVENGDDIARRSPYGYVTARGEIILSP